MTTPIPPICEKLRERCIDWDGTQIPDEGGARTEPTCGELREASEAIIALVSALEPFVSRIAVLEDVCRQLDCGVPGLTNILVADLRRAAATLSSIMGQDK